MNLRTLFAIAGAAVLSLATPLAAAQSNVALGKSVTITGEVGVITCCFPDATTFPPAPLSSLVDGVFRPAGTYWQDGTVWWDERHAGSLDNIVEIDLGGVYTISFLSIQADNNDFYAISRRDRFGVWTPFVTAFPSGGPGMQTRAGAFPEFEATAFRIDASGGDLFYSLAEFQAIGVVPEPAVLALFAVGLAGLGLRRRKRAA